jgi:crotonobetainyl-CoA:carnitine CoA-transferase CaiB-like acyl-CoA transferase
MDALGDDVPNGAIYSVADIINDLHFKARDNIVKVDTTEFGTILMQGIVPKLSETPGEVRWAGSEMGAFNREIYIDKLGLSEETFRQLQADGVI